MFSLRWCYAKSQTNFIPQMVVLWISLDLVARDIVRKLGHNDFTCRLSPIYHLTATYTSENVS